MNLQTFKSDVISKKNKLYRFAFQILESQPEAEDTVQEVMIKLWDMGDQLDEYQSIEALAVRMVKNLSLNKRKAKRNQMYSMENLDNHSTTSFISPDKAIEMKDTKRLVEDAMEQLSETQEMILRLRDIEEYEMEEIAKIMQKDETYIRVNLCRARKKISEILINQNKYGTASY